ncbi:MAG: hypothetical protein ACPGVK_12090 [Halocynthiibacter sp.]
MGYIAKIGLLSTAILFAVALKLMVPSHTTLIAEKTPEAALYLIQFDLPAITCDHGQIDV